MNRPSIERTLPLVDDGRDEILRVEHLTKHFHVGGSLLSRRKPKVVRAVEDVTFNLLQGETLGLVGESGCGKTTLSRMILRLIQPTAGSIHVAGIDALNARGQELKRFRSSVQIVFQDPFASLDPRRNVGSIIAEPLQAAGMPRQERMRVVADLLGQMGMDPNHARRYPHQFSGGQRQRIGVARAMSVKPALLVLDEPVSALDVSIQAQVLNMLTDLRREYDLSYVLISHDLSVVRHVSDRVAVMYLGRLVELADRRDLFSAPAHPYTKALLSAAPIPDPQAEARRERIILPGDVPNPADPPAGCPFHPRCFHARDVAAGLPLADTIEHEGGSRIPTRCVEEVPALLPVVGASRWTACHFALVGQGDRADAVVAPADRVTDATPRTPGS